MNNSNLPERKNKLAKDATLREQFAGLAMEGLCHATDAEGIWAHDADTVAIAATNYADALLAELDKVQS
jgi:hypothetical protein